MDERTHAPSGLGLSAESKGKLLIFTAAGLSFLGSIALWFSGAREEGMFVGLWVPSILAGGALLTNGSGGRDE